MSDGSGSADGYVAGRYNPPLPAGAQPPLGVLAARAARLRCPYCGAGGIFAGWLTLKERCPRCRSLFEREEGYFVGAYAVNLIVAEFLAVAIAIALLIWSPLSTGQLQIVGVALAVGLPILFFPFSRTFWMALDLYLHPPTGER